MLNKLSISRKLILFVPVLLGALFVISAVSLVQLRTSLLNDRKADVRAGRDGTGHPGRLAGPGSIRRIVARPGAEGRARPAVAGALWRRRLFLHSDPGWYLRPGAGPLAGRQKPPRCP